MLYHLFIYLDKHFDFPGAGVFQFISFRAGMAMILSLIITTVYGSNLINYLRYKQVGETVRNLGLEGQTQKAGTPTMGGLIIIAGVLIPTILFAKIENIYIILMIVTTVWLGAIGFLDDYIKVFRKNKEGLAGKFKIVGQIGLGLIVGCTLFFSEDVTVRQYLTAKGVAAPAAISSVSYKDVRQMVTTIPFAKNNELDYHKLFSFASPVLGSYARFLYIPL